MDENEIKSHLLKENEEYKKSFKLHRECEEELKMYENQRFLSDTEKLRQKELKKQKLVLKDKMYFIMKDFKESL
jgi:uncharacterized protein YdcH (DUF465 family)